MKRRSDEENSVFVRDEQTGRFLFNARALRFPQSKTLSVEPTGSCRKDDKRRTVCGPVARQGSAKLTETHRAPHCKINFCAAHATSPAFAP
jgi:hypothetical protein